MRVLVCGGRGFRDYCHLSEVLDSIHFDRPVSLVIEGDATGADRLAGVWAKTREPSVAVEVFPAEWRKYGRRAGFIRNTQMLEQGKPDLVVAFPGGVGTNMMIRLARTAGIKIRCIF